MSAPDLYLARYFDSTPIICRGLEAAKIHAFTLRSLPEGTSEQLCTHGVELAFGVNLPLGSWIMNLHIPEELRVVTHPWAGQRSQLPKRRWSSESRVAV